MTGKESLGNRDGGPKQGPASAAKPTPPAEGGPPAGLRVVVADAHPATHAAYEEFLGRHGCQLCIALSGPQLVEQCRVLAPDLVIACVRLPDLDGVAAAEEVCRDRPLPVILLSDGDDAAFVGRAMNNPHVLALLSKPLKPADLAFAVALAVRRFKESESVREQLESLQRTLDERKLIERAKGAIMSRAGLSEAEAYRRLRKLSSNRNQKLAVIAQTVVTAEETFLMVERGNPADAAYAPVNGPGRAC